MATIQTFDDGSSIQTFDDGSQLITDSEGNLRATAKPDFFKGWTEPESAANTAYPPDYPYNQVIGTESGHLFEMDDSPGRERVRLTHRTGTFIEMHPNGDEVHKVYGDGYEITIKDKNVLIKGTCYVTIEGDALTNIKGSKIEYVEGNYELQVKGNFSQVVGGITNIASKNDLDIRAGNFEKGSISLSAPNVIYINSDTAVNGELTAQKIYSKGRIDANNGISAGFPGFATGLGGISVGFPSPITPVPVPGQITCIGNILSLMTINAGVGVNAPLGSFGIMDAILMTDLINTSIFDSHLHKVPKGISSPPLLPMI